MNARVARYGRARRAAVAVTTACAVALMTVTALAPSAVAHAAKKKNKSVMVVEVVNRAPYGDMLATVGGASLYTTPSPCTGGCLSIWPPLTIPKGKKIPTGVSGLSTAKLAHHPRQITYNGKRLYTFSADRGGDVTGNGVGGFSVATAP